MIPRDEIAKLQPYRQAVRIGAGGGMGMPEAAAAAFVLLGCAAGTPIPSANHLVGVSSPVSQMVGMGVS